MITGINHVGLSVTNLDRSIKFYRDAFHLEVIAEQPFSGGLYEQIMGLPGTSGRAALMKNGSLQLELFEFCSPQPKSRERLRSVHEYGISHFCVEVVDIEEEYDRLKRYGVSFHCAPLDFRGEAKATYGRDPDGNIFELWERGSVERSKSRRQATGALGCSSTTP